MKRSYFFIITIIYLASLITALFMPDSALVMILRLSAIVFALTFVCVNFPKDNLLKLALIFTLLADAFLTTDNFLVYGVMIFCIAQFFHLFRLADKNPKIPPIYLALILVGAAACLLLNIAPIFVAATLYGGTLILNLLISGKWYKNQKSTNSRAALIGFSLFLLCDLCVGAAYLSNIAVFPTALAPLMNYVAWTFYFPSQIFLANSSKL